MRRRGTLLFLGSAISVVALCLILLRCGGDGDGGGILPAQTLPADTSSVGYIDGVVYDASGDTPLEGARVTARGVSGGVQSDGEGKFFFPVKEDKEYILTIEKPGYTYAQRRAQGLAGREVALDPVYLVPLDSKVTRIGPEGGTHMDSSGRIDITFPPGAVSKRVDVRATMLDRGKDLPYPLPPLSKFTVAVNIQPESLSLKTPAKVRIQNFLGFPPGTPVPVGIYTRESARWNAECMGVVTDDGSAMEFGANRFSFYDANFPVKLSEDAGAMKGITKEHPPHTHRCKEGGPHGSAKVGLRTGNLYLSASLPPYRSLGIWRGVNLEYNSLSARPKMVIASLVKLIPGEIRIPETIGYTVSIGGVRREVKFGGDEGEARFAFHFDGRNARGELLPTGSYPFRVDISSDYRGSYYTAAFFGGPPLEDTGVPTRELVPLNNYYYGWLPLHNQSQSPFGSGWGVRGLQRLYVDPQGRSVLVTEGGTYAGVFVPVGTYRQMEPSCVRFLNGMGTDGRDRLYFTSKAHVWQRNPDGTLTAVAGNGEIGFGGDGEPAIEAMLWTPTDVAFDSRGNMYIADTGNNRIRKVNTSGIITTYAGSGEPGFGGDGGPATDAKLFSPTGVAVDSSGNLYIADNGNNRIRSVDPSGVIITYAGTGVSGFGGDGGPATEAKLTHPHDIALDPEGNLYIADTRNNRIRKVGTDGIITTVAGIGTGGFSGNGGAAVNAQIWHPYDVVLDREGNLYIADFDNSRIRRVDRRGIIDTWAGGGEASSVDGVATTEGWIYPPHAMAMDSRGTLYIGQVPRFGECYPVCKVEYSALGQPQQVLLDPPRGDFTRLRQNPDLTFTRTLKDGTEIHFDQRGYHVKTVDLNGHATLYEYDAKGRLVTITGLRDQVTRFEYGNGGKLSGITDPVGRETHFEVDGAGDLRAVIDPEGAVTRFDYDNHLLVTSTDPQEYSTNYVYDPVYSRVTEVHYPTGEVRRFSHTDMQGLINELPPGAGTPEDPPPLIRPDEIWDTFIDGEGKIWAFKTNRFGHITEKKDPIGRVTLIERDWDSLPTRVELANGEVFTITWDARGNPTAIIQDSIDAMTSINYHPVHNKVEYITDAQKNTTSFRYDDYGNLRHFYDAESNHYELTYYEGGLLETITNPLQKTTTFTYNDLGNLETVTDPMLHTTAFGYDDAGNISSVTNANANVTTYRYDRMNRLIEVIDAEENVTRYGYDEGDPGKGSRGLLLSITNARGKLTTLTYDEVGQLREVILPLGQIKTFDYYLNRWLKSVTTPNRDFIQFIYDDAGQLRQKHLPEGTVFYNYDEAGNLTYVDNGVSVINMAYDLAGRLTRSVTALTFHQPATAIEYAEYDKVGNLTSMNDGTATTEYTPNRVNQVTDIFATVGHIGYTYDGLGRRKTQTPPSGIVTNYEYDDSGRLLSIENEGVSRFDYTEHDGVGNRLTMTAPDGAHGYIYDDIYQLTIATHPQSPVESYTYDEVGNRRSSADHPDWQYDDNNRLTDHNGTAYTYDDNGNMVTRTNANGTTTYEYDSENRLIRITDPESQVTTYTYDGLGRRIENNVNGVITRYVYDLEDILFEYDGNNDLVARYTHGPGIDDPVAMECGGETYAYHTDGLGSITHITDSSGTVVASYGYDSFGNIVNHTGSLTNPYTFTGREYDPESGLYYYRARYYDPKIGKFLQPDPLDMAMVILIRQYSPDSYFSALLYHFSLKDPMLISNLYLYLSNNPVNWRDPRGLRKGDWWDPRTYLGFSATWNYLLEGEQKEYGTGKERKTITFVDIVGFSILDIYIGDQPRDQDFMWEYGLGLGDFLGIGHYRIDRPCDVLGGIVIHIGVGFGTPLYVSGILPVGEQPQWKYF